MIKGNERRIIVIEKAEDPYFERAVFYIRRGVTEQKGKSMGERAQEIFDEVCEVAVKEKPAEEKIIKTQKKKGFFRRIFDK